MFPEISCVIPGASKPEQVISNLKAIDIPALTSREMAKVKELYDTKIKGLVHQLW